MNCDWELTNETKHDKPVWVCRRIGCGNRQWANKPGVARCKAVRDEVKVCCDPLACIHRGQVIGAVDGTYCGFRGRKVEIYACDIHVKCQLRKCSLRKFRFCNSCSDREPPT